MIDAAWYFLDIALESIGAFTTSPLTMAVVEPRNMPSNLARFPVDLALLGDLLYKRKVICKLGISVYRRQM